MIKFDRQDEVSDVPQIVRVRILRCSIAVKYYQKVILYRLVLNVQKAVRGNSGVVTDLRKEKGPRQARPPISTVRWFSPCELFQALGELWDYMLTYAHDEKLTIPDLNHDTRQELDTMKAVSWCCLNVPKA
jgi:hypothetical protein